VLKSLAISVCLILLTSCVSNKDVDVVTTEEVIVDQDAKMNISQIVYDINCMRVSVDTALYTMTDPTFLSLSKTSDVPQNTPYLAMDIIKAIREDMDYQIVSREECFTVAQVYDNGRRTWVFRLIKIPRSYLTNQGINSGIVYKQP